MWPRLCQLLSTATGKQKPEHSSAVVPGHVGCRRAWSLLPVLFYLRAAQQVKSSTKGGEKHLRKVIFLHIPRVKHTSVCF